jgi:tetratricopeptide (TPR) repeat protein
MHAINSIGGSCINCHMPAKVYMGNDLRHDHSFRIPRPDLTVKYGIPNTCNSCHKDKTAEWAAAAIQKNFGPPHYHFAEDLIPGSRDESNGEVHLAKLLGDTATPEIVRAAAIDYIGKENTPNAARILMAGLGDTSADVRFRSLERLSGADPSVWLNMAAPLLKDSVRAVRIAAAELFTSVPENQIPQAYLSSFYNAKAELERWLGNQTDFAQGNVKAGDYYKKMHRLTEAEKYYRRALKKDDRLTIAKINLASTLNEEGKNEEALQQLEEALKLEPNSDHIYYSLGLLYAEMNQPRPAIKSFQHAIELKTLNTRVYYNYALLLQQQNKKDEAEQIFLKGLRMDPGNGDLLYALTILYIQEKQMQKAMGTAQELKKFHPDDPNYQPLLQQLKL